MAGLDLTEFDFALKEYYDDLKVESLVYKNNTFLALIPKMTEWTGDTMPVPVIFSNPQNRSASPSIAFGRTKATKGVKFNLTRVQDYAHAVIDNETLMASANDRGAFIRAVKTEMDGAIRQITHSIAIQGFRSASGSIGRISSASNVGTATITLTTLSDITNFEVGQILQLSATDGAGAGVRAGTVEIAAVDRDAGTITATGNWTSGIAAAAADDFIFEQGDYDEKASGLKSWIPDTAPTSTPFFGVARNVDPVRLGGIRVDTTAGDLLGATIEESIIETISRVEREGGIPTHCFINQKKWRALDKAMVGRQHYIDVSPDEVAHVSFRGIEFNGTYGPVVVLADHNCPENRGYVLQMDVWSLCSLGKVPFLFQEDGLAMLRGNTSDDVRCRYQYYANYRCEAPGFNAVIKF